MNWEEAVIWLRNKEGQEDLVKDCFFDDPLIGACERYWKSSEWEALRRYLPNIKGNVLDVGAGRGISSFAFAKDGWKITALEPDSSLIVGTGAIEKISRDANLDIEIIREWGEKIPFPNESFDVVFARQALHHAKDLNLLCKEMGRVLKKGGTFIAIREHVISKKEDLPIFLASHPIHKLYGGENAFLLENYKKSIKDAGIKLIHVLNPLESDINSFPQKNKYFPKLIMRIAGNFVRHPGRSYSFIGKKI
jgi:ubiquinone/menaquinone biosynthesis C-methylase UbiE